MSAALHSMTRALLGVSIAVFKNDEVVLVQRGHPPYEGSWSFPGGKVQPGETLEQAARRELHEETGLEVSALQFIYPVEMIHRESGLLRHHIVLMQFAAHYESGQAKAMDDARALRWEKLNDLSSLNVTEGLENHGRACWKLLAETKP